MRRLVIASGFACLLISNAFADPPPPQGAKTLTEILQPIEKLSDFGYFDEVEWDNGAYEVKYYTKDGVKKRLYLDPATGNQR